MNLESVGFLALFFLLASVFALTGMMQKQRLDLRRLEIKLDALLKQQGIEWPTLSPQVQALALNPGQKIAAIKRYRDENPGVGLAEAKTEIEAFLAKKQ